MKQKISTIEVKITIGFLYWINETHNLRGLKNHEGTISIMDYPQKLEELYKEYSSKYPNGLTGWSE